MRSTKKLPLSGRVETGIGAIGLSEFLKVEVAYPRSVKRLAPRLIPLPHGGESRSEPFVLDADEPPVLLCKDSGANPVELILHGIACRSA
jgi:hypothetical protein